MLDSINWALKPEEWGRGYAFEAAQCMLKAAFKSGLGRHEPFKKISAYTQYGNQRSIKLMERLGMVPATTKDEKTLLLNGFFKDDLPEKQKRDRVEFKITAREFSKKWPARAAK